MAAVNTPLEGKSDPIDLESQVPADPDTEMTAFERFLDLLHPMGPSVPPAPPSRSRIIGQRIVSVAMSIFLVYIAGLPFAPMSWVFPDLPQYVRVAELVLSHSLLAGACYFDFRMASLAKPMVVKGPYRDRHRMGIRKGRLQKIHMPLMWYPFHYRLRIAMELSLAGLMLLDVPGDIFRKYLVVAMITIRWAYLWLSPEVVETET